MDFSKGAGIIDAEGKTILPGLIDNHVHYRDLLGELFLAHAVTSVRDLGNPLDWILAQEDAPHQRRDLPARDRVALFDVVRVRGDMRGR